MRMILLCPPTHGLGHRRRMIVLRDAFRSLGAAAALCEDATPEAPPLDDGRILWAAHAAGELPQAITRLEREAENRHAAWAEALRRLNPRLVISDVDAAPLAAARALGIHAVLVSNFTWADLLHAWGHPEGARRYAEGYGGAEAFALPFQLGMLGASQSTPIPHLAWPAEKPKAGEATTVVFALGKGNPPRIGPIVATEPLTLLVPQDVEPPATEGPIQVSRLAGPVSDAVSMADAVITKGGYSTVAECVAARTAIFLVPRDGAEDEIMAQVLGRAGVATIVQPGEPMVLPTRTALSAMRAAYERADPAWTTCDPVGAANTILQSRPPNQSS